MGKFFNQSLAYTLLAGLVIGGYVLLVIGIALVIAPIIPSNHPLVVGLLASLIALFLNPLRIRIQKHVDSAFFLRQTSYYERLQFFSHALTQARELSKVIILLREYIDQDLRPIQLHIFLHDTSSNNYHATLDDTGTLTSELHFSHDSVLVEELSLKQDTIFLRSSDSSESNWGNLLPESARLAILGAKLLTPLPGHEQLVGWVALGARNSGNEYSPQDLNYLESLCDQASLAIERFQGVIDLERRMHEMDILTRVARGVNITLAFEDVLELIYTQTNQVIPSHTFRITLCDNNKDTFHHAFILESGERIGQHEYLSFPSNQGLEAEIIHSGQSLLTYDYEDECLKKDLIPDIRDVHVWLGVPLNTGSATIGAISLSNQDPNSIYSKQQCNLLQVIADQTAGAIVKTRLLAEAEQRTRQLSILNEVGRSLTSTLEIEPLLTQIMHNATNILNCEAGSLFLLDPVTDELVFEVTIGPVAEDLEGKRLPPGVGIAGKAVVTRQPVIANDVLNSQIWFNETDRQTGFITRDVMVVPMQVKDHIIGVIEVINKQDGTSFTHDDQKLLDTFASQAAIAIENARLYTQTDEALTARIEEMSVMQHIDRELNTNLDLERIMEITLEKALQQSSSNAGFIGLLEQDHIEQRASIHVMASLGYPSDIEIFSGFSENPENIPHRVPVTILPVLSKVIEERQTLNIKIPANLADHNKYPSLLTGTKQQIVAPILRQEEVIGLLFLESTQKENYSEGILTFLSRLCDHAAIAISNAQLYADLQTANVAKSEFVSLVSHELKTPMTSIKGYADLLAQGTVGPINEDQTNFINTIRSNVNRMDSLVSDLTDVSRIEAGRLRIDFGSVSIMDAINEVVRSYQAQIDDKEQSLELQILDDLTTVWGDYDRIIQILTNLVNNANKYTPSGGKIFISTQRRDNKWDSQGHPEVALFCVQDTGYGVSAQDQQFIFQKFFRSEDQHIRDNPGTGLGLNITRHLVEMQGGRIWFESELGRGTSVFFTLPITSTA